MHAPSASSKESAKHSVSVLNSERKSFGIPLSKESFSHLFSVMKFTSLPRTQHPLTQFGILSQLSSLLHSPPLFSQVFFGALLQVPSDASKQHPS